MQYLVVAIAKCAAFFDQFFLVELDITSTGCVAFCCLLHIALRLLRCVVLRCDVMLCVVICLLLVTLVCWLKISQFSSSFVARFEQQLDGRTAVRPAGPSGRLNKQNSHCVFSTGKHRFLRGIFVIKTTFLCLQLPWLS